MRLMAEREQKHCAICGTFIPPHLHYIAQIDVFFNPDMPEVTKEQLEEMDFDEEFSRLVEQMQKLTPEEAQDQVHRRFEYAICWKCQRKLLANPLGLPRERTTNEN